MARTLLQLTQEFARRLGLPQPVSVVNSQDAQTLQMWGLLNEGQCDLGARMNTQATIQQARLSGTEPGVSPPSFFHAGYGYNAWIAAALSEVNTAPGGGIGSLGVACPMPGFVSVVPNTFWEVTSRIPVYGPLTEEEWVYVTTFKIQPTRYSWKFDTNFLYIYPYSATAQFTCMYRTRFAVCSPGSVGDSTPVATTIYSPVRQMFTADNDFSILPDYLVLQDLKWRWRNAKGLPYAEDQRACEQMVANLLSNEPAPTIVMDYDESPKIVGPGLYIATGNTIPP